MAQATLVETQISDVPRLVDRLKSRGFSVESAFWLYNSDGGWHLYLVTNEVTRRGLHAAYKAIYDLLHNGSDFGIDLFDIKLVAPDDPTARTIASFSPGYVGRATFRGSGFTTANGTYIESVVIY